VSTEGQLQRAPDSTILVGRLQRFQKWGLTAGEFMLVQCFVQLAQALTGIILVRCLAKNDYAFYTIANTWLLALVTLSDSGVGSAATALGGVVWQDRFRLGQVVASALRIRHWLAAVTILPVIAILVWTLIRNGAGWGLISIFIVLVGVIAYFQLTYSILVVVLRLQREVRRIQLLDAVKGLGRLVLTAGAILVYLDSVVALVATAFASAAQYVLTRKWMIAGIDPCAPHDADIERKIKAVVRKQWPNEVNGVFAGQLSIILLSFFGTSASVADLGALGRISLLFMVFGTMLQSVVFPRYAICQEPLRLKRLYWGIVAGSAVVSLAPVLLTWAAPGPFLWILGPKYKGLSYELMLVMLNAGVASITGVTWGLNSVRAWIISGWWLVPVSLGIQFSLMLVFGVSTIQKVLLIGIVSSSIAIVINVAATFIFSRNFTRV
jgi:O-antigen/teichoic acid export membrane protein